MYKTKDIEGLQVFYNKFKDALKLLKELDIDLAQDDYNNLLMSNTNTRELLKKYRIYNFVTKKSHAMSSKTIKPHIKEFEIIFGNAFKNKFYKDLDKNDVFLATLHPDSLKEARYKKIE